MAANKNSVTGISFNKEAICIAQFFPEERLVANIGIQPIEEQGIDLWESVGAGLKELVKTVKLTGENVISSLPGEHAVIRRLNLDADEPNVNEALEWEFCQQIIGSRDEYSFDYERLAPSGPGGLDAYLAVGYRSESVERLSRMLRSNKLNPVIVDLDIFALINVFEANYDEELGKPAVLVLADEHSSKCVLTCNGLFIDSEFLAYEAGPLAPGAYAAAMENSIAKMLACTPQPVGRDGISVYLSGMLFADAEFTGDVGKAVRNAQVLYPFRKIRCGTGMPEEDLRKYSPQLAVPVGLSLRGGE